MTMSVDTALNRIRDDLKQSWNDWDVTHGELKDISSEISKLTPTERNEAISKMSDEELSHWASEANSGFNGMSAGERKDLLNGLAQGLDGKQLGRVSAAFGAEETGVAVASHASTQQKLDYLQQIQGKASAQGGIHSGLGYSTMETGNAEARAAAQVLGSLPPASPQFAQAIKGLSDAGKLDAVIAAAAGHSVSTYSTGTASPPPTTTDYKPEALVSILNAAKGADLQTRAAVFKAASGPLRDMQIDSQATVASNVPGQSAAAVASAMSHVLSKNEAVALGILQLPEKPASASINANIAESQKHSFPADLGWFKTQVQNKGPWDYKQQGAQYEKLGNFNYGVTAAAMGIPEQVALRAAGKAQHDAGTSKPEWGGPTDLNGGPYGDDPLDQEQIKKGYDYYNSGLWRVWPD